MSLKLKSRLAFLATHRRALFYCAVSTLGALCYGYDQIYYTGVQGMDAFVADYGVPASLPSDPTTKQLTTTFLSLTTSIIYVGELLGALLCAPINDRFGRKPVFYLASACIIAGAVLQLEASGSRDMMVGGRILIGLGVGAFTVTCLLYIGEVAPLAVRGPALMGFQLMQSCSQLLGSGVTKATEDGLDGNEDAAYRIPFGLLMVFPGIMIVVLPFIPESPAWYEGRGKVEKAAEIAEKIHPRKRSSDTNQPAGGDEKRAATEEIDKSKARDGVSPDTSTESTAVAAHDESSWKSLFASPIERRKLLYSAGAMVAQQINGIQFFYSYGVVFAQSLGLADPFTISIVTNALQVAAVALSVALGNRVPRRSNLLWCSLGLWASLLVVGGLGTTGAEALGGAGTYRRAVSYAIVVFSYVVIVCFNFSLGPLAFTIASETAGAGANRNKIMSCSIVSFFVTVWLVAFVSPYLYYDAGLGPMLGFVYAATTLLTLAYVWFCVGETTGRSNAEIERFFVEGVPVREWKAYVFETRE